MNEIWEQIEKATLALDSRAPETPSDVGPVSTLGTGGSARSDHAHRGITSITKGDDTLYGALTFVTGNGIIITPDTDDLEITFEIDDPLVIGDISVSNLFVDEIFPNSVSPGPGITLWSTLIIQEELRVDSITAASESPSGYVEFLSPVVFSGAISFPESVIRITDGDSPYTASNAYYAIFCDSDGGAITVNLPAVSDGVRFSVKNCGTSGNDVTLTPNGTEQIMRGGAGVSQTISDGEVLDIIGEETEGWH